MVVRKRKKLNEILKQNKRVDPPRITLQLIIYVLMFELNCATNIIVFYHSVLMRPIISDEMLQLLKIFRWFHHFSPLALLYLHPVMLKKYRSIKKRKQASFFPKQ
jgi:hypothetical protein